VATSVAVVMSNFKTKKKSSLFTTEWFFSL